MNNFYVWVVTVCEDDGKLYSHAWRLNNRSSLDSQIKGLGAKTVHLCESKKKAMHLAEYWNECYKENGTYMFSSSPF